MDVSRKKSTPNFLKNVHFLFPDMHTYLYVSGGKKCSFSKKFGVLSLLETPVFRFYLIQVHRNPRNCRRLNLIPSKSQHKSHPLGLKGRKLYLLQIDLLFNIVSEQVFFVLKIYESCHA